MDNERGKKRTRSHIGFFWSHAILALCWLLFGSNEELNLTPVALSVLCRCSWAAFLVPPNSFTPASAPWSLTVVQQLFHSSQAA